MKQLPFFALAAVIFAAGCAPRAERTQAPPAGPVVAQTTQPGVIPAGTDLVIRTNQAIETEQAVTGQTYSAQIAEPVVTPAGQTLIPRGSEAELFVVETARGGVIDAPKLSLALRSITIGGQRYPVTTAVEEQNGVGGLGADRRTAVMVGGGALLGTLVGAAVGGGTGAAIGAITGGAAGAAAQVLTQGDEIRVPAETLLRFRVDQPLQLEGFQQ